jgi:thioredoxin 1
MEQTDQKHPDATTDNIKDTGQGKGKRHKILLRIILIALIILAAAGLYIWKNIGKDISDTSHMNYQSSEFDLDATINFNLDEILSHNLPVIIDFGADTCIPCKEMAPILKELNQELRGKAVVKFVDVWKNSAASQAVPLDVIPTQFFFNADGSPYVPADEKAAAEKGIIMYTRKDTGKHVFTAHQGGMDKETILSVLTEMGMK